MQPSFQASWNHFLILNCFWRIDVKGTWPHAEITENDSSSLVKNHFVLNYHSAEWLKRGQSWELYRGKLAELNDWSNVRKEKLRWLQHYGVGDQMEDAKRRKRSRLVGRHAVWVVCGELSGCVQQEVVFLGCCSVTVSCWLFATPWAAAQQAPLSFTTSQSLLKLMPVESVMPSHPPPWVPPFSCPVFPSTLCNWGVQCIFWNALAFWLIHGKTQDCDNMILFVGLIEVINN